MKHRKNKTAPDGVNLRVRRKSQVMTEMNESVPQSVKSVENLVNTNQNENKVSTTTITTVDQEQVVINKFIISGSRLLGKKDTSIPYILEPIFPQSGVIAIAGSSDTGKSSLLRQFATSIVHGDSDFLGFKLNIRFKRIIYVSTEDDETNMSYLLSKQNPNKIPLERYSNLGFIFDTSNILEKIERAIKKYPVDCVFIDAFSDLFDGDMNQANRVRSFLNKFSNLGVKYKTLFIFLHHTSKRTENLSPSKNNLIGSQGFEAKMRLVIELRKDFSDPSIRHLCIVKGNYLPSEFKDASYVLTFDENMRFANLNRRVPFDRLVKPETEMNIAKEKAMAYKLQGHSINEIVQKLLDEGYSPARSTIGGWIRDTTSLQSFYGYEDDEPNFNSEDEPNE